MIGIYSLSERRSFDPGQTTNNTAYTLDGLSDFRDGSTRTSIFRKNSNFIVLIIHKALFYVTQMTVWCTIRCSAASKLSFSWPNANAPEAQKITLISSRCTRQKLGPRFPVSLPLLLIPRTVYDASKR